MYPQTALAKPIDDPNWITLLCMTRGRPESLVRAIEAADRKAADPTRLDIWLYVDEDDHPTHKLIESDWIHSLGISINWQILPRPLTLHAGYNTLWQRATNAGIYLGFVDDYEILDDGWDQRIRDGFAKLPKDRLALGYPRDPTMPKGEVSVMIVTAEWVNKLGYFTIPYFPYWYADKWSDQIADMIGRKLLIEFQMMPLDGRIGKTRNLWDLPFWTRFFHLTLVERVDEAREILNVIYPSKSPERALAFQNFERQIENFEAASDAELSDEKLTLKGLQLTAECSPPDARYRTAFKQAKSHIRKLKPKIEAMKTRRLLKLTRNLLFNDL